MALLPAAPEYTPRVLLPRPGAESMCAEDPRSDPRPGDAWLPDRLNGTDCAVDFTVTSGFKDDMLATAISDPVTVWKLYDEAKGQLSFM